MRDHNYEYLTSLVRIMMHLNFVPNSTIIEMLDAAAAHKTKVSPQGRLDMIEPVNAFGHSLREFWIEQPRSLSLNSLEMQHECCSISCL